MTDYVIGEPIAVGSEQSRDVVVERHGAALLIRLSRTARFNAIGGTMLRDLIDAFEQAAQDDDVRVVVTTGAGGSFCVGADVADFPRVAHLPARELLVSDLIGGEKGLPALSAGQVDREELGNAGRVALRLWSLEKPTIAAVNGPAVGGGFALALLHDLRLCSSSAQFGTGFLTAGLAPEMGTSVLLPNLVGGAAATELLYTGRMLDAAAAQRMGIVSEVIGDDELLDRALELATRIATYPALAAQLTKRLLRRAMGDTLEAQLRAEYSAQVSLFDDPGTRSALDRLTQRVKGGKRG
ncbi:short chain enoyl-CoA hydratase /enoyl-CoA hydratase [Jatrophihabitans sp. GAS493]|uniref:enoyl-CoA hydratase/isomerase family protein n=1 Tax=Jatrophihabitans sp. GAS493 TaxID=1907575 RepID=UPI000BB6D7D0|nr:enoyl-CoA hydratase/isomerase family protein [Jatrophihabitans sp. GAS493]SOD72109.1 short chain enoyl-CoA hydratase /enoyl-CoA hydratase [Jatrophihabitans sp. GAS493]